jgi:hypothetical protein
MVSQKNLLVVASRLLNLIAEFDWDVNSKFSKRFKFFRWRKDALFDEDAELQDVERDVERGAERGVKRGIERDVETGVVFVIEPSVALGVVRVESTILGSSKNGTPSSLLIEDISDSPSFQLSIELKLWFSSLCSSLSFTVSWACSVKKISLKWFHLLELFLLVC